MLLCVLFVENKKNKLGLVFLGFFLYHSITFRDMKQYMWGQCIYQQGFVPVPYTVGTRPTKHPCPFFVHLHVYPLRCGCPRPQNPSFNSQKWVLNLTIGPYCLKSSSNVIPSSVPIGLVWLEELENEKLVKTMRLNAIVGPTCLERWNYI